MAEPVAVQVVVYVKCNNSVITEGPVVLLHHLYTYTGCEMQFLRKDLMSQSLTHLYLVSVFSSCLATAF